MKDVGMVLGGGGLQLFDRVPLRHVVLETFELVAERMAAPGPLPPTTSRITWGRIDAREALMTRRSQMRIDGLQVDVYEPASGEARARLLLCHGAWVGGWIWEDFAAYLAERGYPCYAPTWRGHYDSRPVENLGKVSMLDYVEDARSVQEQMGIEVVVGESAGGLIAQKLAEGNSALRALALMNPAPPFMVPQSPLILAKQVRYLPDLLLGRPNLPTEKDYKQLILNNIAEPGATEFYRRICAESGRALAEMSMGRIKVNPNKITCPVYLVVGHLDVLLPPKVHMRIARMYGAEVAEYPNMSHHTFSEDGWDQVADEMIAWLTQKLAPSREL